MLRRFGILVVLSLLGALLFTSAAATAAPQAEIAWEPCYRSVGPFECARVNVPLDYDDRRSPNIGIFVVRLPAADPAAREGAIFFNPGGPGGSGVDFVVGVGPFLYTEELRAKYDFIGFDPRGIARSAPLLCFDSLEESFSVAAPWAFPFGPDEEAFQAMLDMALDAACEANARSIVDHMATANVARDVARIASRMGETEINYAGYSYGSFLGMALVNLFPDRVRTVVIDGVLDPVAWTTGAPGQEDLPFSTRLRSDAGAQATLDEFFRLCDEAGPAACALAGDAAERYAAMAAVLAEGPVEIIDPFSGEAFLVRYSDLIGETLGAMYNSASWPFLAFLLADLEALLGTAAAPTAEVTATAADLREATRYLERRQRYRNFIEGFVGVACSDSENPDGHEFWSAAGPEADAEFGYFGRLWTWASSPCAVWSGFDEDRLTPPFDAETELPVLVVGNLFDPATRYEGALIARDILPNSSLLTLDGWGHVSLFLSQCADTAVANYLITGVPPADGTVCTQDFGPFDVPPTSAEADARHEARLEALRQIAFLPPSLSR